MLPWATVAAWCLAIYGMSDMPAFSGASTQAVLARLLPGMPGTALAWANVLVRKAAHLAAFGILALLARRALLPWRRAGVGSFLLAILYAAADEWHQAHVPGRTPAWSDVGLDGAGAALALWLATRWRRPSGTCAAPGDVPPGPAR